MSEITIRYGGVEDCPAVLDLLFRAFAEHRGRIQPESSVFRETGDSLQARMDEQTLLVAETDGGLVGCIFCSPKGEMFYFGRLAVDPDARRHGIAQKLIQSVEDEARAVGYDCVTLEVRIVLERNIVLFQSEGYEITGSQAHHGYDHPTYYTMVKTL